MNRKIPQEAFDFYVGEGLARSYQSVAKRFGVTKNAVVALAKRERWQERLVEIEAKVRKAGDERAAESLEESHAEPSAVSAHCESPLPRLFECVRHAHVHLEV